MLTDAISIVVYFFLQGIQMKYKFPSHFPSEGVNEIVIFRFVKRVVNSE